MIKMLDSFDKYETKTKMTQTVPVVPVPWWKRWPWQSAYPARPLYVTFSFRGTNEGAKWERAEAIVQAPEGVDRLVLEIECYSNGKPVVFSQ